jgi:hypothetical protein
MIPVHGWATVTVGAGPGGVTRLNAATVVSFSNRKESDDRHPLRYLARWLSRRIGRLNWSNPASEDFAESHRLRGVLGLANTHYLAVHERELENPA